MTIYGVVSMVGIRLFHVSGLVGGGWRREEEVSKLGR